jgi:hypothetical protein
MTASSPANSLSKVRINGCKYVKDKDSDKDILHVNSPHALTQAAGYLKYIYGKNKKQIFFRGQSRLYATLSPTLFRDIKNQKAQSDRITALREACAEITKMVTLFDGVPFEAQEPLLQHYGLKTSWIDLVDNIWVALWFACHRAHTAGELNQYLHFEQRDPHVDKNPFAYILLISTDSDAANPYVPGLCRGSTTEMIDLRVAAPSIFLRPHAQHGVLFRMRGRVPRRPIDYSSEICGIIRIELREALAWLGAGKLTGTHTLFPPAFYDQGYAFLLSCGFSGSPVVGAIHHIGT